MQEKVPDLEKSEKQKMEPNKSVLDAFGASEQICRLEGGQGTAYRCGDIVLKPTDNALETTTVAEIMSHIEDSKAFRVPRPIKATSGDWVFENWAAWAFIDGKETKGRYKEKFEACEAFHKAISSLEKPDFLNDRTDPWSEADRVAWQEKDVHYDAEFLPYIQPILARLERIELPEQIIHGDITGNFLFAEGLSPAIIDFSPYWRPAPFAKAIMVIDAIAWEKARPLIASMASDGNNEQLLLRAALRRIAEQPEHVIAGFSSMKKALNDSAVNFNVLKQLGILK